MIEPGLFRQGLILCVETNMWKDRQELIQDGCRQPLINQTWLIHEDWELSKITGWWYTYLPLWKNMI